MAGLTVYHRERAGRPIRLVWTLEEAGADYDLVVMDAEQGKSAEHLARHPLGRVPALVDDEGPLFESTALCFHVAELYPDAGLLPPAGTHERALAQQWAIFAMTELEAPAIESYRLSETDPEASAKAAERARKSVAALEEALHGSPPRLVGDRLTVADIVAGSVLRMVVARLGVAESSPVLEEYFASFDERPARQRAVARLEA
jgi:glutathione S-transferase